MIWKSLLFFGMLSGAAMAQQETVVPDQPDIFRIACPPWCLEEEVPPGLLEVIRPLESMILVNSALQGAPSDDAAVAQFRSRLIDEYNVLRAQASLPVFEVSMPCPPHCFPSDKAEAHAQFNAQAWEIYKNLADDPVFFGVDSSNDFSASVEAMGMAVDAIVNLE